MKRKRNMLPEEVWNLRKMADLFQANRFDILLGGILLAGVLLGALFCRNAEWVSGEGVALIIKEFAAKRADQAFWLTFASSFESVFVFYFALLLSGVSAIGVFTIPFVLLFRGLGLGLVLGYLYSVCGMGGVLYALVLILPHAFFSSLVLIVLSKEGIRLSNRLFRLLRPGSGETSLWENFRLYCIRSGIMIVFLCISALIDSTLTVLFAAGLQPHFY